MYSVRLECPQESTNRSRPIQSASRGRAASPAGTAGTPAAPGSSRCRGGRCRPSAPRPRRAPGRCRRRGGPGRVQSSGTVALVRASMSMSATALLSGSGVGAGGFAVERSPLGVSSRESRGHRVHGCLPTAPGVACPALGSTGRRPLVDPPRRRLPVTVPASRSARGAARPRPAVRPGSRADASRAYVALTKPRIIELLLVTTVPGDVPRRARRAAARGWWSRRWSAARWRRRARTPSTASSTRDIDAVMQRTGHRPLARGQVPPRRAGVRARRWACCARVAALTTNLAGGGARRRGDPVLRLRLHDAAQAPHLAEHRLGRRRRAACR